MKKIIILLPFTFLKRDYERFGIEILKKNFQVRIIDFSPWFHFNSWKDFEKETYRIKEYVLITKEKDFVKLNLNSEPLIIFDFLDNSNKSAWVRNKLKNNSNIFFVFTMNPIPKNKASMILTIKKIVNLIIKPKKLLCHAKIRSTQKAELGILNIEKNEGEFLFDNYLNATSPGQACVLYLDDQLLGGGWIAK